MEKCFSDSFLCLLIGKPGLPIDKLANMDEVWAVHGKAQGFDHCWLEMRTENWWFVYEPQKDKLYEKEEWYKAVSAIPYYRLQKKEWSNLRLKCGHLGPYTDEERAK